MKLFILYQTDNWKSKASRVSFGVFDTRAKAIDSARGREEKTQELGMEYFTVVEMTD